MNPRFIDWIWNIRGTLRLAPEQSGEDAIERLTPLFYQTGTSHERAGDTLTFSKKDPAAQDKMSIFDSGILHVERSMGGVVLRYRLTSKALLLCFLAPLLFLGFAQLNIALSNLDKPDAAAEKADKDKEAKKPLPLHPIDKALGAPAPEAPKKDSAKQEEKKKKHSATPAYVFAAIFAVLYIVGRLLEDRLIARLFRRRLQGA